jgi:hypothetical protein
MITVGKQDDEAVDEVQDDIEADVHPGRLIYNLQLLLEFPTSLQPFLHTSESQKHI